MGCCGKPKQDSFNVLFIAPQLNSALSNGLTDTINVRHYKQNGADLTLKRIYMAETECTLIIRESDNLEKLTKKQLQGAQGIVFLVDSAVKKEEIEQRAEVLRKILSNRALLGLPCLLFAMHQDQNTAFSCDQLEVLLDLSAIRATRYLLMHCCSGEDSGALLSALKQLSKELLKRQRTRSGKMTKARHSFSELTNKAIDNYLRHRSSRSYPMQSPYKAEEVYKSVAPLPSSVPYLASSKVLPQA